MKRAKEGLIVILRQAMTNKITRFFAVLLVLAIIGVTVVSILRSNGQIAWPVPYLLSLFGYWSWLKTNVEYCMMQIVFYYLQEKKIVDEYHGLAWK